MRRLLVLIALFALLLVGCQPRITEGMNKRFGHNGVDMTLTVRDDGYVALTLSHDGMDLFDTAIAVRGDNIRFNSDDCVPVTGGINCTPGEPVTINDEAFRVLTGDSGAYTLLFLGDNILANATYYVMTGGVVGQSFYLHHAQIGGG